MLNNYNFIEASNSYALDESPILSVDEVLGSGTWEILKSEKEIINHIYDDLLIPNSAISTQKEALCFC